MRVQRVIVHTQNKTRGKNSLTTQKKPDISYLKTSRAFNVWYRIVRMITLGYENTCI